MFLRQFPIAPRAAFGFAIITLLLVLTGLFSLNRMSVINDASTVISQSWLPSVRTIAQINLSLTELRQVQLGHVLASDTSSKQFLEQRMREIIGQLGKAEDTYKAGIDPGRDEQLFERYLQEKKGFIAGVDKLLALSNAGEVATATELLQGPLLDNYRTTLKALTELSDYNTQGADAANAKADADYASATNAVISVLVIAALVTVALAWALTRSITVPLGEAVLVAGVVASGDLTGRIDTAGNDEPAKLLTALQRMQQQLRGTIQQIGNSATQLASAAEELNAVTEEGNRSLTRQHDEIEMAATAVNEMTAAVEEVARNASSTSDASRASEESAQSGRDRVQQTVQAIRSMSQEVAHTSTLVEGLADRAQSISKVLDVIRAIAEQTNLLALNAAIEAARAGEQGRGFAVVADEVRALAHRTQESTREIEQMIGSIQSGTGEAVGAMNQNDQRARQMLEIAEAAGRALEEITEQVGQINERTLVIASAAEEQAQVAREVDRNLVNIRDISVQTATGANQTAAASQELSRLAVELNGMVARFTV
ncbi:methyl-accepting chemotaxis protein [Pseudomonas sp. No.21]|uniref:methyl-accepting chemotaxis protein n=1 Tax=Pseudomonas TaxID=286 RepID=UPI000DA815DD|nr:MULTISPECIES: methyl-accepting chemotaxis protein [Pseudomonas]MDW3713913.1 methyl-accepting chemotaxis protein [Pseudomonas sp. 2023EL-01195]PZE10825.1 methyl-accepting chemotaxis protein [Pseudomonas sp. 57B-090624]GJN49186.1 chemotaxis transducer [Pseudomonas tohonis]